MSHYMLIHWDIEGNPTALGSYQAKGRALALDLAASRCLQLDDHQRISVSDGRSSWRGMVGQLFRLGVLDMPWSQARATESALLQTHGGL